MDDDALRALLRTRGMRVTSQRLVIHRALHERGGHLSSEQVHAIVSPTLPGISQQTVYSTLGLPCPDASTAMICRLALAASTYAIRVPSGDQAGM